MTTLSALPLQALEFGAVDGGDLVDGVLATLLYFLVGAAVLAVGFVVLDALTPGDLRAQVYTQRHGSAAVLLAANHLALAAVVVTDDIDHAVAGQVERRRRRRGPRRQDGTRRLLHACVPVGDHAEIRRAFATRYRGPLFTSQL